MERAVFSGETARRFGRAVSENGLYPAGMARRLSWQGGKAGMVGTRFVWYGQTGIRDRVDVSGLAGRHQSGRLNTSMASRQPMEKAITNVRLIMSVSFAGENIRPGISG